MARGKSQYLTNAGKIEATPIWLIQILGVEERADPATTHNYYFTDAGEAVSFFNEIDEPEAYLPIGMEVSPVDIDTSQKMVSFTLKFDNVSRQMALLAGTVRLSSGRCVILRAFMEDISDPAFAQTVFRGSIRSWTIGEQALELEIGSDIPLINKAPRRLFSVRCQWRFKGTDCGYTGQHAGFYERWWLRTSANYNVMDLTADVDLEQISTTINYTNFNPLGQADYYNCRIEGVLLPKYTETYTIYTTANNGVKIWVDDVLIVDQWTNGTTSSYSATVALTADTPVSIVIENFEATETHRLLLEWSSASQTRENIGTTAGTVYFETAFTTCDKSLDQCKERLNHPRFGGFPHIPQSRDPRVAWTKV